MDPNTYKFGGATSGTLSGFSLNSKTTAVPQGTTGPVQGPQYDFSSFLASKTPVAKPAIAARQPQTQVAPTQVQQPQAAYDTQTGIATPYGTSIGLPTRYTPKTLDVPTSNSYGSDVMNSNANPDTLKQMQNQKYQAMNNGTNPGYIPSDSLIQQIFQNKQFTPEEQANMQNLADINSRITASTLAERRQIQQLYENGQLSKEAAANFASESQRRANASLADLAAAQTGITNTLGVQAAIRNNQLGAYQTLFDMTKGSTTLSPGQGLYSATGNQVAGAAGVAPQITSTAMQLYSQAASTGTTMVDANGNPDMNYYMQQASQLTGLPLPQGSNTNQGYSGYNQQGGSSTASSAGGSYGSQGYGNIEMIAPAFRSYVQPLTLGSKDVSYIDLSRVPLGVQNTLKAQAQAAGIPTLDEGGVNALASANTILNVIESAKLLAQKELAGGTFGRFSNITRNKINDWFQTNPELASFNNLRETAAKTVTALGGGVGSGLRMNLPMIDVAVNNMPTANDNYETAVKKAENVQNLILEGLSTKFPQFKQSDIFGTGNSQGSSTTGGGDADNPFSASNFFGK